MHSVKLIVNAVRSHGLVGMLIVGAGCSESAIPTPATASLTQAITVDVASMVNSRGQFVLAGSNTEAGEISAERAKELAVAYWRAGYTGLEGVMAKDRGAAIHSRELEPCPRAYYAASAYSGIPVDAPEVIRSGMDAHWLVGLCYRGTQEVVISVAAKPNGVVLAAGETALTQSTSGVFRTLGVPLGVEIPAPPEQIAALAFNATGRRLSAVPLLVQRPRPKAAALAVWQVELETPAALRGGETGAVSSSRTLFIGHLDGWHKPAIALARHGHAENATRTQQLQARWIGRPATSYLATRREGIPQVLELAAAGGK